jgi:DNA-binding response OmpR family regulator
MAGRVLVVEDDEPLAELEATLLRRAGYEPTVMHAGATAVAWVRENDPEMVLLDLMLPDGSGYDICRTLKLDRETNLTPVIIITAKSAREDLLRGLRVGANYYLTKPFTMEQLYAAIDHVRAWRRELDRSGAAGEVHFQLRSDAQYLEELNRLASSLFLFSDLSEAQVFELTTAVREMGANAIEWGNQNQVDRPVMVTYRIDPEKLTITIRDSGAGFDRSDLPHAASEDDPTRHLEVRESKGLRVGGFGIFMTRGLVDDMQYNEAGNEVRLVKRLAKSGTN